MDYNPLGSSVIFPGKNAGVCCHLLLHGSFPTQGTNPRLLHWQADSELPGKPVVFQKYKLLYLKGTEFKDVS